MQAFVSGTYAGPIYRKRLKLESYIKISSTDYSNINTAFVISLPILKRQKKAQIMGLFQKSTKSLISKITVASQYSQACE